MKELILLIMGTLWLVLPTLGFSEEMAGSNPDVAEYVLADDYSMTDPDEDPLIKKKNKENETEWLIDKKTAVTTQTEKNEQDALEECARRYRMDEMGPNASEASRRKMLDSRKECEKQYMQEVTGPGVSAFEHADENAEFQRDRAIFNNKANTESRSEKRITKKEEKETERKEKAEKDQDKGEGQFKFKF